ncbi:MAG TPA: DUF4384 domain-containing protein [Pyrinomonadaceae bacterium]|nr:DUF4384 domain-containing protein [Pyrinomonadaceae bacterium]
MRLNSHVPQVALALALGLAVVAVRAQQATQAEEGGAVRGAFRNTRPGANRAGKKDAPAQTSAAQPAGAKPAGGTNGAGRQRGSLAKATKPNGAEVKSTAPAAVGPLLSHAAGEEKPPGIALGYTLFMRAPTGEAVRVSNTREFKSGDSVRLLIETNTDGYLYIFNAENDTDPLMIFPNAKLQRGANLIRAHVPYEIPSSAEADENLRWLSFDDRPARERVYFIVSRKPLEGVPAGEALVRWCAETSSEACAWSPQPGQWDAIKKSANREQVATSRAADEGHTETPAEHEAATRGLGLAADAPLPSVIYMITSANAEILVAAVDLIHR